MVVPSRFGRRNAGNFGSVGLTSSSGSRLNTRPGTGSRLKTQNPRLISRGGFLRGAGLAAGAVAAAGLGLGNVARAAYAEPPHADYVIHHPEEQRVWVYPLDWAGEYGPSGRTEANASYDWYLPGTITGYVLNGPDDPLPDKDNLDIPVVSGNAPNAPAYPNVEIPEESFSKEYVLIVHVWGDSEEWMGTVKDLHTLERFFMIEFERDFAGMLAENKATLYYWDGENRVPTSFEYFESNDRITYDRYLARLERLGKIRSAWKTLMDTPDGLWSKYYQWDVKHFQYAVDNYNNVLAKSTTPLGNPMYFFFGQGGFGGVGHVKIMYRDVAIRGEPGSITLPNGTTTNQSAIYGGGTNLLFSYDNAFGSITMDEHNPPDANGNPTGFNLAVEGVHFDSCQYSAILAESSREYINIHNCVFTNTVETEGPWTLIGAERWSNAVSASNTARIVDSFGGVDTPQFLNGAFNVTNCRFEMLGDGIISGAINADDSDTLGSVTATGNTIYVKNSLPSGATRGIYCRDLPNAIIRINNNIIEATDSGIVVSPHLIEGDLGYAEIKDNIINIVAPQFIYWPQAIGIIRSIRGALIEGNQCILNGEVGNGISIWQSSNCTVRNNHITSIGPICFLGISADGDGSPPEIWDPGLPARNNRVTDNIVEGGPYIFGFCVRDAENSFYERNDFSNSFAFACQGFLGNNSFNNTFRNNKWGSVDAYEGIAGFLVVDVSIWTYPWLLKAGPVEYNTFTNENFIGDYPGWNSGMGCFKFDSWEGYPPANNTITALKSGTKLFGYDLCMQVRDVTDPDFSDGYQGLNNFPGIAKCTKPLPPSKEQMMQKLMAIKARLPKKLMSHKARFRK
ncbi:right-handed parallel beta-helix repeat-containing protein [Candidatus Micrarchaeota archaeon]|nr:right-handed parallel beta-helix repeat-containing protein [Candidatus Micrarchaeota archaeon]